MQLDIGSIIGAIIAGLVLGGLSGGMAAWVAFRIKFERFQAMDLQREKAWTEWREHLMDEHVRRRAEIDKRLDAHADEIKDFQRRVTRLERNGQ